MIELARKELIEMHASCGARTSGRQFSAGYISGLEDAIEVLEDLIAAGERNGVTDKSKDGK